MKNLFVAGNDYFARIEALKERIDETVRTLDDYLRNDLRRRIAKAKYVNVSSQEYMIEVSVADAKRVPSSWVRVGKTQKVVRFRTQFIDEQLDELNARREQLELTCAEAWASFLTQFSDKYEHFRVAVQRVAEFDCLCALSEVAVGANLVRPTLLCDEATPQRIEIVDGRNPLVERALTRTGRTYVPNSLKMDADAGGRCVVLTGPNMGGKSSLIRQVALTVCMAQLGSFVPAARVALTPFDGVYTRMGAEDDIAGGRSTFFVEVQEASSILRAATPRSLIILDELGRGTSTHDGVALALATLEYIVEQLRSLTLFVTHYHSVSAMHARYPDAIQNYHMAFVEHDDDEHSVVFLYALKRGSAQRSYGLNVARLAGLSQSIIARAAQQSQTMADAHQRANLIRQFLSLYRYEG